MENTLDSTNSKLENSEEQITNDDLKNAIEQKSMALEGISKKAKEQEVKE